MKNYLFIVLLLLIPQFAFAGSQAYSTPGTHSFSVPSYGTLTVEVWGGGGGGGMGKGLYSSDLGGWLMYGLASGGGNSSFGSVVGYGGSAGNMGYVQMICGGSCYYVPYPGAAVAGGAASGGDVNTAGGTSSAGYQYGGAGAAAATGLSGYQAGGGGGGGNSVSADMIWAISWANASGGSGGGGGGYSRKTYSSGALTPGSAVSVVVGSAGVGGGDTLNGAGIVGSGDPGIPGSNGSPGAIQISWTSPTPTCTVTLSPSSINQGSSSTLTYSSTNATTLYIANVGYVSTAGGSTTVAPSSTTNYGCTATGAGGTGTQAASLTVYASCTLDGTTVTHGSSATAYLASTVPYGSTCSSQTRACTDGTLSGSYAYASCSVSAAASCTLDGTTVAHGSSITSYSSQSAPSGQLCSSVSQSRTCSDGTLSGSSSYQYASCSCTPSTVYSCSPQNVVRAVTSSSCAVATTTPYATCVSPAFCSAGSAACLYPPVDYVASGALSGHLAASPSVLPQGTPTRLYWNLDNVSSCTVSGNGATYTGDSSGAGGQLTGNVNQQTVFTLTCTGLDGSAVNETVTVNILPVFQER